MYCKKPFLFVNKVLKKQQQKTIKINTLKGPFLQMAILANGNYSQMFMATGGQDGNGYRLMHVRVHSLRTIPE